MSITAYVISILLTGVIFTSQTAVEASLAALSESVEVDSTTPSSLEAPIEQVTEQWKTLPVFVVGRATATAGDDIFHSEFYVTVI